MKKYSDLQKRQISVHPLPFRLTQGALAIVTAARRDAVDADVPLTNGTDADGEVVWSWRLDAGVKSVDASFAGDGGKRARLTGESTKEAVKTIARGMPGVPV